jgi:hypothetical protein
VFENEDRTPQDIELVRNVREGNRESLARPSRQAQAARVPLLGSDLTPFYPLEAMEYPMGPAAYSQQMPLESRLRVQERLFKWNLLDEETDCQISLGIDFEIASDDQNLIISMIIPGGPVRIHSQRS